MGFESQESHLCDCRESHGPSKVVSRKGDDHGAVFWGDSGKGVNQWVLGESLVSLVSMDQLFRQGVGEEGGKGGL